MVPPLHTSTAARRPWLEGNSGKMKSANAAYAPSALVTKLKIVLIMREFRQS